MKNDLLFTASGACGQEVIFVVVHDDKPVGLDVRIAAPRGLRESLAAVD